MSIVDAATPESASDFGAREHAWIALSELFRDTELQDFEIDYIARALREGGLDAQRAEEVLLDEVAPVFAKNLLSGAGNWTGWPAVDVVRAVSRHLKARSHASPLQRGLGRLRAAAVRRMLKNDWSRVIQRLRA